MSAEAQIREAKKRLSTLGFVAPEAKEERLRYVDECLENALAMLPPHDVVQRNTELHQTIVQLRNDEKDRLTKAPSDALRIAMALESVSKSVAKLAGCVDSLQQLKVSR